jgi:hypothetical protein
VGSLASTSIKIPIESSSEKFVEALKAESDGSGGDDGHGGQGGDGDHGGDCGQGDPHDGHGSPHQG